MEKLHTVKQVAEILNVEINTVYIWIRTGRLKSTRIGKMVRISDSELQAFIARKD